MTTAPPEAPPTTAIPPIAYRMLPLIADGLTNAQIGRTLHMTLPSVKNVLTTVRLEWKCATKAHIVARAYQLGHLNTATIWSRR